MRLPGSGPRGPANETGKDLVKPCQVGTLSGSSCTPAACTIFILPCRCQRFWTCVCKPKNRTKKAIVRRFAVTLLITIGAGASFAAGADGRSSMDTRAVEAGRPDWCRAGWECTTLGELAQDTIYKIKLEQEIVRLRGKSKALGCVLGGGLGVSAVVDISYDVHYPIAPHVGLTCGIRF